MHRDSSPLPEVIAEAALASIAHHRMERTPRNFEMWYEYHRGLNFELKRTLDIMVANGRCLDDRSAEDVYDRFLTSRHEEQALRATSVGIQKTLQELLGLAADGRLDATAFGSQLREASAGVELPATPSVAELLENLLGQAREMASSSDRLARRLVRSAEKIETLERTLVDARREATTDGLTGIANRRSFELMLREVAGEAMNSGDDVALLLLDVDHFKSFNDRWGHQTGDEVLRLVASTLRGNIRQGDHAFRYGGEEFAIILPGTSLSVAVHVAEKLRAAVAAQSMPVRETPPTHATVSVSTGVSCYDPDEPLAVWVQRTDKLMYRAKQEGRNRVVRA